MSNYHGAWEGLGFPSVADSFALSNAERAQVELDYEILHAVYSDEDYSGVAFVVLRSRADGSLWEVNGSHCSCYALENLWDPDSSCIESLSVRHTARPLLGLETVGVSWLHSLFQARDLEDLIPLTDMGPISRPRSGAL